MKMNLAAASTAVIALLVVSSPVFSSDLKGGGYSSCAQFGGGYIGGQGGSTYYSHKFADLDNFGYEEVDIDNFSGTTNTDFGLHGGIQAGWNWQRNCTVFGVQADWSWSNTEASSFHTDFDPDYSIRATSEMNWVATFRTRAGVVVDNLLLYATGGLALADFDQTISADYDGDTGVFTSGGTRWGLAVGAGTEWAVDPRWTLSAETLYLAFENKEQTYSCAGQDVCSDSDDRFRYKFEDSALVTRIGFNYRWDAR